MTHICLLGNLKLNLKPLLDIRVLVLIVYETINLVSTWVYVSIDNEQEWCRFHNVKGTWLQDLQVN